MLTWLLTRGVAISGGIAIGILLALTWSAAVAIPGSGGLRARYYANDTASGAHERSTDFRDAAFTRVDQRIDFVPGRSDFPLMFFNDNSRFNFYLANQPQRHLAGILSPVERASGGATAAPARCISMLPIRMRKSPWMVPRCSTWRRWRAVPTRTIELTPGWHRLDVVFRAPYGSSRRFGAGEVRDGTPIPFDAAMIVTQPLRDVQFQAYRVLRVIKSTLDVAALLWLTWLFVTDLIRAARHVAAAPAKISLREGLAMLAIAGALESIRFAWPWSGRLLVMVGGDDPMTYEGYARDILLNGILMNGGVPPGQGEPFYYQAFYPYFLAAVHVVFGEGMFGVLFVQRALGVALAALLTVIAVRLAGARVWPAALGCAALFTWWKFWPIAADLLSEALYIPLLAAATMSVHHHDATAVGAPLRRRGPATRHGDDHALDRIAGMACCVADGVDCLAPIGGPPTTDARSLRLRHRGVLAHRDSQLDCRRPVRADLDGIWRHAAGRQHPA